LAGIIPPISVFDFGGKYDVMATPDLGPMPLATAVNTNHRPNLGARDRMPQGVAAAKRVAINLKPAGRPMPPLGALGTNEVHAHGTDRAVF